MTEPLSELTRRAVDAALAAELKARLHAWIDAHHGQLVDAVWTVRGADWIEKRRGTRPVLGLDVTWEAWWWRCALEKLHAGQAVQALTPILGIKRSIGYDEAAGWVHLRMETTGIGLAGAEWGLPDLVRQTPLPECPPGGDVLLLPKV